MCVESGRRNKGEGQVEVEVCDAITASLLSIDHLTCSQAVLSSLVEKVSDSLVAVAVVTNHRGYAAGGGAAHDQSTQVVLSGCRQVLAQMMPTVVETFDAGNPYRWLYCRIVIPMSGEIR